MISALAARARRSAHGLPRCRERCAEFVWRDMRDADGVCCDLQPRPGALGAYLEDYAFMLEALLTLYEATFDPRWLADARELAETIVARFGTRSAAASSRPRTTTRR